ncbi:MAG: response regulator receiver domain [Clostridiales bacterium]|nr:response regulator receiver domain [Clostridiales bacterium]
MKNDCYEEIVKKSLRYVACIDDEFVDAYEYSDNPEHVEFTKNMYRAIEQTCDCHVEILPYSQNSSQESISKCLENKDLLILDWELAGKNDLLPLKILVKAYEINMPFVCIYTNDPDVDNICQVIQSYFSGYSDSEVNEVCKQWIDAGIMESDFKSDVLELSPLLAEKPNSQKIIKHVKELFDGSTDALVKLKYDKAKSWIPLWLKWSNAILPEKRLRCASKSSEGTMIIDGMFVCCLPKPTSHAKETVNIEDLISTIAAKITETPNSVFNLVWLHYSNALRSVLQSRSQLFTGITDIALGYLSKELLKQGDAVYNNWMKEFFRDEILDRMDAIDMRYPLPNSIFECIREQYKTINPENHTEELVALNEKIMVNHMYSGVEHRIDFGDVFVTITKEGENNKEIYWMCVTPKCDCLRSERKIENNYLFVKGNKMDKPSKALADAESEYWSFIKNGEEIVSINWGKKLISVYFEEEHNCIEGVGKKVEGVCSGKKYSYTYLSNVKENYVQRIANSSFAECNRVGITLAQVKKKK